jgi:hypothetical protein
VVAPLVAVFLATLPAALAPVEVRASVMELCNPSLLNRLRVVLLAVPRRHRSLPARVWILLVSQTLRLLGMMDHSYWPLLRLTLEHERSAPEDLTFFLALFDFFATSL